MVEYKHKILGAFIGIVLAGLIMTTFWESRPGLILGADPTPAGGTAGVYLIDAVGDLTGLDPNDDDVVILGTAADGGMLLYDSSATNTVDNVKYYAGPNSIGRYIRFNSGDGNPIYDMGSQGGAVTVNWGDYNNVLVTLTLNTTFTFTDPPSPRWLTLVITQDVPGGRIITWPTLSGSTPIIDGTSGATTVVLMFFDGTSYHVF